MKKLGLILLSILLVILFLQFDVSALITSISKVPIIAFIGLLLIQIISQLLVNYQWCRIGRIMGKGSHFLKMLYINSRGSIIESITPGVKVGGEVTRALLLKNELNYSAHEAATLVTIQKIVSFSSFLLVNLFAFAHISNEIEIFQGVIVKILIYSFLIALLAMLVLVLVCTSYLKSKIMKVLPKYRWTSALKRYMLTLLTNIKMLKNIKGELLKQFLLSLVIWVLFPVKMVLLVLLFTSNVDVIFLTEVTFISYMVGMIPLMPGGLGGFEATMTGLLIAMQITASDALAITLLFRFITFWFVILLSLVYSGLWKIGGRRKCHLQN